MYAMVLCRQNCVTAFYGHSLCCATICRKHCYAAQQCINAYSNKAKVHTGRYAAILTVNAYITSPLESPKFLSSWIIFAESWKDYLIGRKRLSFVLTKDEAQFLLSLLSVACVISVHMPPDYK